MTNQPESYCSPVYPCLFPLVLIIILLTSCTENDPRKAFQKGDYEHAFELWKPLAEQDDLDAQYFLGLHYYLGLGTIRNQSRAKKWFEKAAVHGHPDAQLSLGTMYQNGESVPQNFSTAYKWYYASAMQGNTQAPKKINMLFEQKKLFPNQIHFAELEAKPYILHPLVTIENQP